MYIDMASKIILYAIILLYKLRLPLRPLLTASLQECVYDSLNLVITIGSTAHITYLRSYAQSNWDLMMLLGAVIFTCGIGYSIEVSRHSQFLNYSIFDNDKVEYAERYIYSLIVLIDRAHDDERKTEIHYALKVLFDSLVRAKVYKNTRLKIEQLLLIGRSCITLDLKQAQYRELLYFVISDLLKNVSIFHPNSTYLKLMDVSLVTQKMANKWHAVYALQECQERGTSFRMQLHGEAITQQIEQGMKEHELKDGQNTGVNVVSVLKLYRLQLEMNKAIVKACDLVISFWKELLHESTSGKKLEKLGTSIDIVCKGASSCFLDIISINPNHIHALSCYGSFLASITNEEEESAKILQKARGLEGNYGGTLSSSLKGNDRIRRHLEFNPCIVIASADSQTMGIIKRVNSECSKLLGWSAEELSGKPIESIMPKIFADHHDT